MKTTIIKLAAVFASGLFLLNSCSDNKDQAKSDKMTITATSTMLGDAAKIIGGDAVEVTVLCGPGVDPHTFVARPQDKKNLDGADVIIYNGLHFESNLIEYMNQQKQKDRKIYCAQDSLDPSKIIFEDDAADPHMWNDIDNWKATVTGMAQKLGEFDPANKASFEANAAAYVKELDELSAYAKQQLALIPDESHVLITTHDAFGYFTQYHGFKTVALQGVSTATEAAQSDINRIKDLIKAKHIKAIFAETSSSDSGINRIIQDLKAEGYDIKNAGELYADALGDEESGAETYIKAYRFNVDLIVNSLK